MFPPLETADENGLLAISRNIDTDMLIEAYTNGIFPWPIEEGEIIPWFSPPKRAILKFKDFHLPKSLLKESRKSEFEFKISTNVRRIIEECSRRREGGTWITTAIITAYSELAEAGYCHSVECYQGGELVGGLYGVSIAGMFAGESMFNTVNNASKLCLWHLVELLQERGADWLDCQQLTPLLESFGAAEVDRSEFLALLKEALNKDTVLPNKKQLS